MFWAPLQKDTSFPRSCSGYLRVDTTFNGGIYGQPAWSGDLGQDNRYFNRFISRMALTVDTRTATEYGVVRTFGQADFQFSGSACRPVGLVIENLMITNQTC